jgi:hypothetical protein
MTQDDDRRDGAIEEIHLPGPSLIPMFTAAGITIGLVGLIWSWPFVAAGGLITLISVALWIRDVREDIAELPTEHRH